MCRQLYNMSETSIADRRSFLMVDCIAPSAKQVKSGSDIELLRPPSGLHSSHSAQKDTKMRSWVKVAFVVVGVCSAACGEPSALEEQLRVLGKQVTTLLDRRREDLASIEDNMRRKILSGPELGDVREEMRKLRYESQLSPGLTPDKSKSKLCELSKNCQMVERLRQFS
ncbi:hypothetical protein GEV33_003981 [Tenebrio molitor]|uniref:Uncharacterized protein n=1 Tax=Tenebrio molitor TaxID=7067 RepID=A0A8J6LET6_TENMO|nr:hypothetical protein GEV33_003981 [Tenebrio molitor]